MPISAVCQCKIKTQKKELAMHVSSDLCYDEKLKPLFINDHTVRNILF